MRNAILILAILFPTAMALAQAPDTQWTKVYGGAANDEGWQVIKTHDGGLAIIGSTQSFGRGNYDVWLIKLNVNGDTLWTRTYGDTTEEQGRSIKETPDHGFILAGFKSFVDPPSEHIYLIKTNSHGDTMWTRKYARYIREGAMSIDLTPESHYMVAGWEFNGGYAARIDSSGSLIWDYAYDNRSDYAMFRSVICTSFGELLAAGWKEDSLSGLSTLFLLKLTPNGDLCWSDSIGNPNVAYEARFVIEVNDEYIVAGNLGDSNQTRRAALVKYDSNGNLLWSRLLSSQSVANSVYKTFAGNFVIGGINYVYSNRTYQAFIAKTNSSGEQQWMKTFGSDSIQFYGHSAIQTNDGGYILVGYKKRSTQTDLFITKLAPDGTEGIQNNNIPTAFSLSPAYPNPFNAYTTIRYSLSKATSVSIEVFDIAGRKVETLPSGFQLAGEHSIVWNAEDKPSGVYFYRLKADGFSKTEKCILLK